MKCTICGYEDDTQFLICPYCGEEVKHQNQYQYQQNNSNFNNEISNNQLGQPVPQYNPNLLPNVVDLPTSQPREFTRTAEGFQISHSMDDGDFYYNYMLFNIIGALIILIFFISSAVFLNNGNFASADLSCTHLLFSVLVIPPFAFLINSAYSIIMNNFTFEVNSDGIYVKSPMKQYFISKSNIKASWFQDITKKSNKFSSFFTKNVNVKRDFIFSGPSGRRSRYSNLFREYDNNILFHDTARKINNRNNNAQGPKKEYNVFIEVEEPIFKYDTFASEYKKGLRIINTGLSFESHSEARFLDQELRKILGLPDNPIPVEYDYNVKTGK